MNRTEEKILLIYVRKILGEKYIVLSKKIAFGEFILYTKFRQPNIPKNNLNLPIKVTWTYLQV